MKKIALTLLILVGTLTAQADGYTYLTFETTDGTKASVAIESLTLSINGTTLTARLASVIMAHPLLLPLLATWRSTSRRPSAERMCR